MIDKSFPFYMQHDTMDCGPTCLRMIAAFYGRKYRLDTLREKCNISREGVSLLGISEAAEKIGFRTIGVKITFEELAKATYPCIIHWNQEHFVVIYDIKQKREEEFVYIADPAAGKVKFSKKEFLHCWISSKDNGADVGVVLLLDPKPDFYEQDEELINKSGFRFLFSYLKPYKSFILQLILGLVFGSLLQLLFPFLSQSIVDFGINNQNISFIWLILIAQLVLTLSSASVEFIRGWILLHLGTRINISLVSDFLAKLMKLPMEYFDAKMVGDILQRINDNSRIQDYLTNSTLSTLFSFVNVIIFGGVLLFYNPSIFFIYLIGSTLYFIWVWIFMKRRAELDHRNFAQQSANQSNVVQLINGMQEIKLNGCEQAKRWDWERIQVKLFRIRIKGLALGQYQDSGAIIINQTKNFIITALVAYNVIEGNMTLGMMIAVQYIIGQLNSPIEQLIGFIRQSQDAKLSLDRLGEIHNKREEEGVDEHKIVEIPLGPNLKFENVSFSYDKTSVGKPTIKNISFEIPSGKQTAIVGTSGSGKTTLVKLMLGFYELNQGDIFVNNNKLSNYSIREWRKSCGIVMQEGFIFSDSIAKNIAPGADNIDHNKLLNAVITANLKDFVESLPLGYNTKIGGDGHGLSQGQKQRILIARAVYKDPRIVFFDEATNALDANNERLIMDNLQTFFKNRTSVVVAHRLSTVRNAAQIIVLEKGEIVEVGTHESLLTDKGAYYQLVKNQLDI